MKIEPSENNITMETESTARKSVKVIAIWIVLGIALGATYGNVAMGLIVGVVVGAIFRSLRSGKTN